MDKRIRFPSELAFVLALVLQAFAVAFVASADLGLSMVVAPSYILHVLTGSITFGQAEYLVQGIMFIAMCIILRRFHISFLLSFVSMLFYGLVLDIFRATIPFLNPQITIPGAASYTFVQRLLIFISGMLLIQFTVALSFKSYLPPLVNDFFVKEVSEHIGMPHSKFKLFFDLSFLAFSLILSLVFFKGFVGIGLGTAIQAVTNGLVIGLSERFLDRVFVFYPLFPSLEKRVLS